MKLFFLRIEKYLLKQFFSVGSVLVGILMFFSSCKEEVQTPPYMGYDYFPDTAGHYVVYRVDSIWLDDVFNRRDTYEFKRKEWIESKFLDNADRISQRIERYKRPLDNQPFTINNITDVWYATLLPQRAEKIEENIKYVKLIFPLKEDVQWDGNAFNIIDDFGINYRMYNVHKPFSVPVTNFSFDSTVTVLQIDWKPLFDYRTYSLEVYAKNIGLVYKHYYHINRQPNGADTLLYGSEYKYYYMEHGYE